MKNIEINEKQKENLLKMCKVLFPEYVIYPADNDGFIEGEQWVGDQNMGEDRPVNEFNIHWFEFCMTHLANKVFIQDESLNDFLLTFNINKHPIDYLYEEFKKLPIQKDRVKEIVFKDIEIITGITNKELNVEYKLSELGLDSLDEVELIMDLEKSLGIYIPDDDIETKIFKEGNTIQHLVDYVRSKI